MSQFETLELPLARPPRNVAVPIELVRAKKTSGAAFTLACDTSGLDDKEIYLALGIDPGYFSNIKKSKATLQGDLVGQFCRVVGNRIYLEWLAYQDGCTLVEIESETQRQLRLVHERLQKAEERARYAEQLLLGRQTQAVMA